MTTAPDTTIVACPGCGRRNRIVPEQAGAVCGQCGTPLPGEQSGCAEATAGRPIDVTDASYATEVLQSPLPVLLGCYATWCGPCRAVAPNIERVAADFAGRAKVCKLDVDDNPRTPANLEVQYIPTLLFFVRGDVVDRMIGLHPYGTIRAKLDEVIARYSR